MNLTLTIPSLLSISETQQQLCIQLEFPHQENPEAVALRWDPVRGTPRKKLNGDGKGEEGQCRFLPIFLIPLLRIL